MRWESFFVLEKDVYVNKSLAVRATNLSFPAEWSFHTGCKTRKCLLRRLHKYLMDINACLSKSIFVLSCSQLSAAIPLHWSGSKKKGIENWKTNRATWLFVVSFDIFLHRWTHHCRSTFRFMLHRHSCCDSYFFLSI